MTPFSPRGVTFGASVVLIAAIAVMAGCAGSLSSDAGVSEAEGGRSCFWASQVTSFGDAGPDRAIAYVGGQRQPWELTLSPGCPNVDFAQNIAIAPRGGGRICSGADAELLVPPPSGRGFQRCHVRSVRKLPDGEPRSEAASQH